MYIHMMRTRHTIIKGGLSMECVRYYFCKDVMHLLGLSESKAYAIIRELNKELSDTGFLTIAGRVPIKYFEQRFKIEE